MSKVRTFSRKFPSYHPNAGQPTYFVEKILNGLYVDYNSEGYFQRLLELNKKNIASKKLSSGDIESFWISLVPVIGLKLHTIRAGKHFKLGDKLSPRVWSGNPYASPQIIFFEDLEIKYCPEFYRDHSGNWLIDKSVAGISISTEIAENDGLNLPDMKNWFNNKELHGQIICWHPGVIY